MATHAISFQLSSYTVSVLDTASLHRKRARYAFIDDECNVSSQEESEEEESGEDDDMGGFINDNENIDDNRSFYHAIDNGNVNGSIDGGKHNHSRNKHCTTCGQRYVSQNTLTLHVETEHSTKPTRAMRKRKMVMTSLPKSLHDTDLSAQLKRVGEHSDKARSSRIKT